MGGDNSEQNLVFLTARAHFICHKLLVKMVTGQAKYKMIEAVAIFSNNKNRKIKFSSRDIAIIREANALASSKRNKGNQYYKFRRADTVEDKERKSISAKNSKWINNGLEEKFTKEYEFLIGERGFYFGRLPFSNEWTEKVSNNLRTGNNYSLERNLKISQKLTGRIMTSEHRKNLAIAQANIPRVSCDHCKRTMNKVNIIKWHNEKCKLNPINIMLPYN